MSDGLKRREFLKVLGVSGAGAGMVGCSTEGVEKLMPYVVPPEEITPGVATWYASVCGECEAGCGMWVRTREGRVVKVEGNPDHPVSGGALCSRGHSSVQGLYNPDRFTGPMARQNGELQPISWDEAEQRLADGLTAAGQHLTLTGFAGPSMMTLMESFARATGGGVVRFDPLADAPLREAGRVAFGRNVVPWYDIEEAELLVSFGADFLESWLSPVRDARAFSRMSGVDEQSAKGRFVFVGSRLSLTGQNADEWLPIQPGSESLVALAMANVISGAGAGAGPYRDIVNAYTPENVSEATGIPAENIRELAIQFAEGPSLALGPGVAGQHRNATAANLAVAVLNSVAGNVGRTLHYSAPQLNAPAFGYSGVERVMQLIGQGVVGAVMIHGSNPIYALPASSGFRAAFESVPFKVSFASSPDETTALCDLVLPDRHFLESWGDSAVRPGSWAIQQPAMRPVPHFDTRQTGDVLLSVASLMGQDLGAATFHDHLQSRWQTVAASTGTADFEVFWQEALKSGVVELGGSQTGVVEQLRQPDRALVFDPPDFDGPGDLHLMVYPSSRFGHGSQNTNRPWLLELPDPVSKITWHSWVEMHPDRAAAMGLRNGDMVILSTDNGSVELPVWTYPGIRENVVAVPMGGGHEGAGRFSDGNGVNPLDLLPAESEALSGGLVHFATKVTVTPTGERRALATISGSDVQSNRPITPAVALSALTAEADHAEEEDGNGPLQELQGVGGFVPVETEGRPQDFPLEGAQHGEYGDPETPRWAMTIDLDKCTGCSACVTACQSENNVAWVGESQVTMGRDMGWIRLERYYEAVDASHAGPLDVRFMPMICQHCGNAPCEPVCPVYATYHTPDGINTQVYNRCVGTRYCLNNCPYKVRVYNWYTYTDEEPVREGLGHAPEPMNWAFNPDVTVRENGIMEKCSFCIHRIRGAQDRAAVEGSVIQDGEIIPACQQSCPAEAIVFGNIRDTRSRVAQSVESARVYRVLDELINTQPAVSYLKKVTFHDVESGEH
jgi:molybdopterin-containing oxidoreductase family iron-sulfur binding subunit